MGGKRNRHQGKTRACPSTIRFSVLGATKSLAPSYLSLPQNPSEGFFLIRLSPVSAIMATNGTKTRERKPSTSAPISDLKGPIGPESMSRPKHKRTATGFGPGEIKSVESSIPEGQRDA